MDWPGPSTGQFHFTLVYLCTGKTADVDNIIKPIQDALRGLVYADDALIVDVDGHRRLLTGIFDLTRLPPLLSAGVVSQKECVYMRVQESRPLEDYL